MLLPLVQILILLILQLHLQHQMYRLIVYLFVQLTIRFWNTIILFLNNLHKHYQIRNLDKDIQLE